MRIIMVTAIFFLATAGLGIVLNETIGYLIQPYIVLGSIPVGLAVAFITRHWFKTPAWIRNQMVEADPTED